MPDYSPEFESFWRDYPKRDGQKRGKAPAYKIWAKLSAAERHVASGDVQKRNRQHGWGKYIQDAERYLKNRGWEDEWEPYSPKEDGKSAPRYHFADAPPEMSWAEVVLGRAFARYAVTAAGSAMGALPEVDTALKIRSEVLTSVAPALEEDIQADTLSRRDAAFDLARSFLKRMDKDYRRNLAERINFSGPLFGGLVTEETGT